MRTWMIAYLLAVASGASAGVYTLPGDTATSVPGGMYGGFNGTLYGSIPFDVQSGATFAGAWGSSAYGYSGDPAKDWLAIPAANNGGNFYSDSDAGNIALRVLFQDVNLTGINNIAAGHQGSATLGVRDVGTTGYNLDPKAAALAIYDQTQTGTSWPPTPSGDLSDANRSYLFQPWIRNAGYIGDSGHGPDAGWNLNPKGGPTGSDAAFDTFDVVLEFAPQPDGTVRMYAFERIHNTWDIWSNGVYKWDTHDFNWNGVHRYYDVLPAADGGGFMNDVYVFAAAGNGPYGTSQGGHSIAWGDILVTGTPDALADPGGAYRMLVGEGVTLDGSGSFDSDDGGAITNYLWSVGAMSYDAGTSAISNFTWPELGSFFGITGNGLYTFTLTVTDAEGHIASAQTTLTVVPEPTSLALLGLGALALARRRRRK